MPRAGKPKYVKAHNIEMPMCSSLTVAGNPCSSRAAVVTIRGKRYKLKTCTMHASEAIRDELGLLRPPRGKVGRKKKQTASQILRDRFEAEAERYLKPFEEALEAMKAVVVGNGASAHIEFTDDIALRLKAIESMLDRIYGRPKQVTELSGADGEAIEVRVPSDEERKQALARVLASTGALGTAIPQNPSASAPTTN